MTGYKNQQPVGSHGVKNHAILPKKQLRELRNLTQLRRFNYKYQTRPSSQRTLKNMHICKNNFRDQGAWTGFA